MYEMEGSGKITNGSITKLALSLKGKLTYVFGGNDIENGKGDCSDFTQYVFEQFGFNIGSDTASQYGKGEYVAREDLKAGDLVFFKNTYDSGKIDGVSHVGISLGGKKFIHLSEKGCIVSSLSSSYYDKHYLAGRRISGIEYTENEVSEDSTTDTATGSSNKTFAESIGLTWWGDIVKAVVVIIVTVAGVGLLAGATGMSLTKGVETWQSKLNKGEV